MKALGRKSEPSSVTFALTSTVSMRDYKNAAVIDGNNSGDFQVVNSSLSNYKVSYFKQQSVTLKKT